MNKIVGLAKRRGFVFPGSEIYGGLAGTWDYGPLGVEVKNNIKRAFWKTLVYRRDDTVGVDASILMNPKVWEASGHTQAFTDPLVECKICHARIRSDHEEEVQEHEKEHKEKNETPSWTEPKKFNLLVEAELGVIEGNKTKVYLRGEITQGVHVNFKNILDSTWRRLPFGAVQIGKAFRNEITPGNFTFRSREFEQMELQYFIEPKEKEALEWLEYWKKERMHWYQALGMEKSKLRFREHESDERAHYARAAWDIEYDSPFGGWKEFEGIHHRGDWDLVQHSKASGESLTFFDEASATRFTPWVIETSGGVDRAFLFFLIDAYKELPDKDGVRTVLRFSPQLAPYKIAVFPLVSNKPQIVEAAQIIYKELKSVDALQQIYWDDIGNIGKRYRRQDEIGTPWCITVDYETLEKGTVTVRDRDTMEQERVHNKELKTYFEEKLK